MTKWFPAVALALGLGLVLSSSACGVAKPKKLGAKWVAARADALDLKTTRRRCLDQALDRTVEITNEGFAIKAGVGFFVACMEENGWELQDEAKAPTPKPTP